MRLHDIESAVLLPRFAHNAEWEQKALDQVVKGVRAKSFAMGAPYTREAISALSDAELQAFYFQYGIAIYYPDLSRETRENMLFELARVYRSLGTPHSVELLCEYIFDGADKVGVEIHDNLAFNAAGELVDDSLLDLFDVDLFPTSPELSQDKIERIVENIFRFCRNSQTLRNVIVEFPSVAECNVVSCDLESFVCTIGGDEIAAEPQPVVVFPTVSINNDFGGSNWLYLTLYENVQMNAGSVLAPTETYSCDSTKAYAVVFWQNVYGTNTGSADVGVVDDNGTLKLKNVSTSPIYIKCARVAVCSDSTVGKTIVYDANGDNHNAFVFNMSGTPYYYVLDGVQTEWTDDLSSIGYTKTVPVSKAGDYGSSNLFTASTSGTSRTLGAGSTGAPYISGTTGSGTYKYSRSYATYYGYETNGGNKIDPTRLGWLKGSGVNTLYWKNISASSLTINWAVVALCSNPCADVVPVYNSSNVAYNAFHYIEDGTDYYYVLDGTQTDWTDDLSSIGYSLTQTLEIILALRYDPSTNQWKTVAFDQTPSDTENYWWGCVIDQAGVTALQAIGLTYHDPSSIWGGSKFTGPIGNVVYNTGYSYEVLALYSDMGTTEVAQSLLPSLALEPLTKDHTDLLVIWSKNVLDTTPVKTWKCRITKL